MTDKDGAPPAFPRTPSQGADGGFNSSDVRGYLLWAVSYDVASAIALRTIDAFTSKPTNQVETEKPKEKEKEKTINCQVVFPSVTTIMNSNDPSNRAQNVFNRPQARQAEPSVPLICKHVSDFYHDCAKRKTNVCEGYEKVIKKCQQLEESQNSYQASPQGQSDSIITAGISTKVGFKLCANIGPPSQRMRNQKGSTSTNISNVSTPTLSVSPDLILMSYHGCMYRNYNLSDCKKYETYMLKTFKDNI